MVRHGLVISLLDNRMILSGQILLIYSFFTSDLALFSLNVSFCLSKSQRQSLQKKSNLSAWHKFYYSAFIINRYRYSNVMVAQLSLIVLTLMSIFKFWHITEK
jgi:hypothetical protein